MATDDVGAREGQLSREFDRAAGRYDLLTRLNPGYHRELRAAARSLSQRVGADTTGTRTLWDLGCGSGLSTQALLRATHPGTAILGLDASAGMLAQARRKTWPEGVRFVQGSAQDLGEVAAAHLDGPADGAFAAYLLRNVPVAERDEMLQALHAQVRPGGWVALHDYHVAGDRRAQRTWTAVCRGVVTPLSTVLRGNPEIYRYLRRSVIDNDSTARLGDRLQRAGFVDLAWSTARGWQRGILHTVLARRPLGAGGER